MYALGLVALQGNISLLTNGAKHVAYADDLAGAGKVKALRKWWENITQHDPPLGSRPNTGKSSLIAKKKEHKELAENLGAFTGISEYKKKKIIKNLVSQWVNKFCELKK